MKMLIAYDGSACADAALHDLRRAGLPQEAEAVILSVADVWMPAPEPTPATRSVSDPQLTSTRVATEIQRRAAVEREAIRRQVLEAVEAARTTAQRALTQIRAYFPDWRVAVEAVADSPAWGIIKKADEWKPDLIVLGSHGYSAVSRFVLGSVSQKVLTTAGRSVRIARGSDRPQESPVRLLLGVDGSTESEAMVQTVARRLWRLGSLAHIVAVVDLSLLGGTLAWETEEDADARQRVQQMVDRVAEQLRTAGLVVTTTITDGIPKRVLIDEANTWGAECVFVGARGLRRMERFFLGSVSTAVATRAQCSVEIIQRSAP